MHLRRKYKYPLDVDKSGAEMCTPYQLRKAEQNI